MVSVSTPAEAQTASRGLRERGGGALTWWGASAPRCAKRSGRGVELEATAAAAIAVPASKLAAGKFRATRRLVARRICRPGGTDGWMGRHAEAAGGWESGKRLLAAVDRREWSGRRARNGTDGSGVCELRS